MSEQPTAVAAMIEKWTQAERALIYAELEKINIGNIKLDEAAGIIGIKFKSEVPAGATVPIQSRAYYAVRPSRLVILEPTFERIERDVIHAEAKIEKKWWRTRIIEPAKTITIERKSFVTVPRSAWRVRSVFMGADNCFPSETDVSGDLFGPAGTMKLVGECVPGIDVTIMVENRTSQAMPFYAVLLGEIVRTQMSVKQQEGDGVLVGEPQ